MKPLYNRIIFAVGSQVWNRAADLVSGPVADRSWSSVDIRVWGRVGRVGFHIRPHMRRCIEGGVR